MKKSKSILEVTPCAAVQCRPGEAAAPGEAAVAVNVREFRAALCVAGDPVPTGQMPAGRQLLLVDGDRLIGLDGNRVMCGNTVLAEVAGEVVGAHRVGGIVVITTTAGIHWLRRDGEDYAAISLADACPDIRLDALEWDTVSAGMEAMTFAAPYEQWPATLAAGDVSRLTAMLRQAWNSLQQGVDSVGAYAGMMRVRCGVRLHDDSYLWLSDPVTLGDETLRDADRVATDTTLDGTRVTGLPATTLTRHRYRLGITVAGGIAAAWLPLVKAVDILATGCVAPVAAAGTAQYRCIGIGGSVRRPRLEMGLPPMSAGAIGSRLDASGWHVVATTTDLAALGQNRWVSDAVAASAEVVVAGVTSYVATRAVEQSDRLSAAEAEAAARSTEPLLPVASMTANGRLYCVDASGTLAASAAGNPLVTVRQQAITGVEVRAVMPLGRTIYAGGFGRYPVVLFTDEGIYALPQTTAGASFGEPRLLDRAVIAPGCRPAEGGRDIYFADRLGHLCRLRGSEVSVVWRDMGPCQLAWEAARRELWCLTAGGQVLAVMPTGRACQRTVEAAQLYADPTHALAVDAAGNVLDLTREQPVAAQAFEWQSQPMATPRPSAVVWNVSGSGTMVLEVTGERGLSCHGFAVCRLRVSGEVNAPLRQRLVAPPLRTVRLAAGGKAASGTWLLKTLIEREG